MIASKMLPGSASKAAMVESGEQLGKFFLRCLLAATKFANSPHGCVFFETRGYCILPARLAESDGVFDDQSFTLHPAYRTDLGRSEGWNPKNPAVSVNAPCRNFKLDARAPENCSDYDVSIALRGESDETVNLLEFIERSKQDQTPKFAGALVERELAEAVSFELETEDSTAR